MNWYLSALRNYANFNGRARRAEYWWFRLTDALIHAALLGSAIAATSLWRDRAPAVGFAFTGLFFLYAMVMVLPGWAASVRRLHDTDRSGAQLLLGLIPLIGGIVVLILLSMDGTRGPNRYGPDPAAPMYPSPPEPGPQTWDAVPQAPAFGSAASDVAYLAPNQYARPQPFIQSKTRFLVRLILVPVLLLAVCMLGGPALMDLVGSHSDDHRPTASGTGSAAHTDASAVPRDGAAKVHGVATAGSRPSSYPVREINDLTRVCDGFYYPRAPRYTGLAPHPIVTASRNQSLSDTWTSSQSFHTPDTAWPPAAGAWQPSDPAKVQIVACADRVATGSKVRTCHVDKPPSDVTMKQAIFTVSLYEVATRNRLAQARLTGDGEECGVLFILVDEHDQTYTSVSDRQLWETFKQYVEQ